MLAAKTVRRSITVGGQGRKTDLRREIMDAGLWLRVEIILAGVFLFGTTLFSLAKRKMTDSFALVWGLISVIFVLTGVLLNPTELARYISPTGTLLTGAIGLCAVFGAYFISIRVSELSRRNLELVMQVTLLKQEVAELKAEKPEQVPNKDGLWDEKYSDRYQHAGAWRG